MVCVNSDQCFSSSAPFPSPPCREGNPIIKDVKFINNEISHTIGNSSPNYSAAEDVSVKTSPLVRIEGFFSPVTSGEGRCTSTIHFT